MTTRRETIDNLIRLGFADVRKYSNQRYHGNGEWEHVDKLEPGESASYGDFQDADIDDDEELYLFSRYTGGSDYSGSTVERSNFLELCKEFGEDSPAEDFVHEVYGGHGTYDVCFDLTWLSADESEEAEDDDDAATRESVRDEIVDILRRLGDYPCVNEEAISELEMELSDEAGESWARHDFERAIERTFDVELDVTDADLLRQVFEDIRERANVYW